MSHLWDLGRDQVRALTPADFAVVSAIQPRWRDNDSFGHINNAVFYEYFDSAINTWLLAALHGDAAAGVRRFVVESGCRYFSPIAYPAPLVVAHHVARLGTTSATYEIAVFTGSEDHRIAALGRWVHVFVDATTQRPVAIPPTIRSILDLARRPATAPN